MATFDVCVSELLGHAEAYWDRKNLYNKEVDTNGKHSEEAKQLKDEVIDCRGEFGSSLALCIEAYLREKGIKLNN